MINTDIEHFQWDEYLQSSLIQDQNWFEVFRKSDCTQQIVMIEDKKLERWGNITEQGGKLEVIIDKIKKQENKLKESYKQIQDIFGKHSSITALINNISSTLANFILINMFIIQKLEQNSQRVSFKINADRLKEFQLNFDTQVEKLMSLQVDTEEFSLFSIKLNKRIQKCQRLFDKSKGIILQLQKYLNSIDAMKHLKIRIQMQKYNNLSDELFIFRQESALQKNDILEILKQIQSLLQNKQDQFANIKYQNVVQLQATVIENLLNNQFQKLDFYLTKMQELKVLHQDVDKIHINSCTQTDPDLIKKEVSINEVDLSQSIKKKMINSKSTSALKNVSAHIDENNYKIKKIEEINQKKIEDNSPKIQFLHLSQKSNPIKQQQISFKGGSYKKSNNQLQTPSNNSQKKLQIEIKQFDNPTEYSKYFTPYNKEEEDEFQSFEKQIQYDSYNKLLKDQIQLNNNKFNSDFQYLTPRNNDTNLNDQINPDQIEFDHNSNNQITMCDEQFKFNDQTQFNIQAQNDQLNVRESLLTNEIQYNNQQDFSQEVHKNNNNDLKNVLSDQKNDNNDENNQFYHVLTDTKVGSQNSSQKSNRTNQDAQDFDQNNRMSLGKYLNKSIEEENTNNTFEIINQNQNESKQNMLFGQCLNGSKIQIEESQIHTGYRPVNLLTNLQLQIASKLQTNQIKTDPKLQSIISKKISNQTPNTHQIISLCERVQKNIPLKIDLIHNRSQTNFKQRLELINHEIKEDQNRTFQSELQNHPINFTPRNQDRLASQHFLESFKKQQQLLSTPRANNNKIAKEQHTQSVKELNSNKKSSPTEISIDNKL